MSTADITFGDNDLAGFLISSEKSKSSKKSSKPGLVICRGFPPEDRSDMVQGYSYKPLAKHIAKNLGWTVLLFNYRGSGNSSGNFSMQGWLEDVSQAVKFLSPQVSEVWLAGFGIGGALAICCGAKQKEVVGVTVAGAPADLSDWVANSTQLLEHSRKIGLISDPQFPPDEDAWVKELSSLEVEKYSKELDKPLLVIHGSDDIVVPSLEARAIADMHGNADVRIIEGVTHRLSVDPRVSAIITGWLYRQSTKGS